MTRAVTSLPEKTTLEATDELLLSDTVSGTSKKVTADNIATAVNKGSLSGELISADADNLLEQGTDSLLKVDADTINSGDADNLMQVVSDKLKVDADNLISSDANNTLSKGTDEKLAVQVSDINSGDADNLLTEVAGKLKADASDFISADAGNYLAEGTDNKLIVDADNAISADASNSLVEGTDGGLFVPSSAVANATETVAGVVELATDSEVAAETETGGTGASLVATPANMKQHKGVCKAWVKFDGVSESIDASYNVSSITDVGTGMYDVNYTNNMSSAEYAISAVCSVVSGQDGGTSDSADRLYAGFMNVSRTTVPTASKCRVVHANSYYTPAYEPNDVYVTVFGELA